MDGELYQITYIVAASKKALQLSEPIKCTSLEDEDSIEFAFLPPKSFFKTKKYVAPNVSAWFEQIKKLGVQDIKLLCPYSVKNRYLLGFSNTTESSILCFYKNGKVTYFVPDWQFDSAKKGWNVLYTEHKWTNPPTEKPHFENNTDSFRKVLLSIKELATEIECDPFVKIFDSAIHLLDDNREHIDEIDGFESQLPQQNLRLYEAACVADVFGGMGSWNDSPSCIAKEKGLDKEYDKLSDELFKNIRLAIMYAINEW